MTNDELARRLDRLADRMQMRVDLCVERAASIDQAVKNGTVGIDYLLGIDVTEALAEAAKRLKAMEVRP